MKLDESDLETTYFPTKPQRIDKSVGYVVIGLAVVLMFSLFVYGMNRIQTVSDRAVSGPALTNEIPTPEISDTVDTSTN